MTIITAHNGVWAVLIELFKTQFTETRNKNTTRIGENTPLRKCTHRAWNRSGGLSKPSKMAGREMYKCIFCLISATLFLVACGPSIQQDTTLLSNDENNLTKEFESAVGRAVAATMSAQPTSTHKPSDTARPTSTTSPSQTPTESDVPSGGVLANVTRVLDGDTIDVEIDGQEYRVRYIGIDTPESGSPCADDATQVNVGLVWQETVTLVKDVSETDRYDRLLRYVYVGETFVNAELVARGYATSVRFPPDIASADSFDQLQENASSQGLGCWTNGIFGDGGETPPV